MIISGIIKLSLLDYPEHVGCTLFSPGCNFKCPFCHNSSLVYGTAQPLDIEEIFTFLSKRKGVLDAVTLSGGEPLLQDGVEPFLRRIKDMGYLVKVDTNGTNPDKLLKIIKEGLVDYVAMDLKNRLEKYTLTAGVPLNIDAVIKSAEILNSGIVDSEFRTTVVKQFHEKGDIAALASRFKPHKYFLQHFVDSGDIIESGLSACDKDEMEAFKREAEPFCSSVEIRGI